MNCAAQQTASTAQVGTAGIVRRLGTVDLVRVNIGLLISLNVELFNVKIDRERRRRQTL
jgi:hypothetical protein